MFDYVLFARSLCDIRNNGFLNREQFALAQWLIEEKVARGRDPPAMLSGEMVPPSMRTAVVEPTQVSVTVMGLILYASRSSRAIVVYGIYLLLDLAELVFGGNCNQQNVKTYILRKYFCSRVFLSNVNRVLYSFATQCVNYGYLDVGPRS